MTRRKTASGILWVGFLITDMFMHKSTQLEVLKNLVRLRHKVSLLATYSKEKMPSNYYGVCINLIPLRYFPVLATIFFALCTTILFPFYVLAKRPRYIIVEPGLTILVVLWKPLLHLIDVKFILDIRSTPVEVVNWRRRLTAMWFNVSAISGRNLFDGITTLTSRMKQELCDDFHIVSDRIGVWTSGVSPEIYAPEKFDRIRLRKELSWEDRFVVMYHGSLDPHRGVIEVVKAIELARAECPNLLFFVLGQGPALPTMQSIVEQKGLENLVSFLPPVPYEEVPKFIAASDIGILPAPNLPMWRNQSPLKLMEYLAMKKVAVVVDVPMVREVIGSEKCGVYVSSANPEAISKGIIYAFTNKKKLDEWGTIGRKIIEERYTWAKVAKNLELYLLCL